MSGVQGIQAEAAALYLYGAVLAHSDSAFEPIARQLRLHHQNSVDSAAQFWPQALLPDSGVASEKPVTTPTQAIEQALALELDCCIAWRTNFSQESEPQLKEFCLDALERSAVNVQRIRSFTGATKVDPTPGIST